VELQFLGGFADCVSEIPLDMIMESTIPEKDQLVEKLLTLGAVPNRFLVGAAISNGKFKLAAMFLRHGADPFCLIEKGETFDPRVCLFTTIFIEVQSWLLEKSIKFSSTKIDVTSASYFVSFLIDVHQNASS